MKDIPNIDTVNGKEYRTRTKEGDLVMLESLKFANGEHDIVHVYLCYKVSDKGRKARKPYYESITVLSPDKYRLHIRNRLFDHIKLVTNIFSTKYGELPIMDGICRGINERYCFVPKTLNADLEALGKQLSTALQKEGY